MAREHFWKLVQGKVGERGEKVKLWEKKVFCFGLLILIRKVQRRLLIYDTREFSSVDLVVLGWRCIIESSSRIHASHLYLLNTVFANEVSVTDTLPHENYIRWEGNANIIGQRRKKSPAFNGTRKLITVPTRARHWISRVKKEERVQLCDYIVETVWVV